MAELASEKRIAALEAEIARLTAALLELHGPPPGPLCRCVNCNDFKPCPGQALSGDDSALKAMLAAERDSLRAQLADVLHEIQKHQPGGSPPPGGPPELTRWVFAQLEERASRAETERDAWRRHAKFIEAEQGAKIASLQRRIADNLCYLQPGEKLDPMLPKPVHLESCGRFYDQEVGGRGVLEGCMTVAQLEEKLDKSEAEVRALLTKHAAEHSRAFMTEQKLAEAERERDAIRSAARLVQESATTGYIEACEERDKLAAQVERYREALQYEYDTSNMDRPLSDPQTIHNLLAETPEQSLSAVREQARREALEEAIATSVHRIELKPGSCRWELVVLVRDLCELAAQPAEEPQP